MPVVEYNEQFNPIKYAARRAKSIIIRVTIEDLPETIIACVKEFYVQKEGP